MLVSIHLPKTAGTSFKATLTDLYAEKLKLIYDDKPMKKDEYTRNKEAISFNLNCQEQLYKDVECIHGHFMPLKYLLHAKRNNINFITWMRNPVDRIISHYFYWKKRLPQDFIHDNGLSCSTTLEEFCLHPKFKNIYTKYLWGFPLENFDFIGITEYYKEDLIYFKNFFLNNIDDTKTYYLNNNTNKDKYKEILSNDLVSKIEAYHAKDISLYERALVNREKRKFK